MKQVPFHHLATSSFVENRHTRDDYRLPIHSTATRRKKARNLREMDWRRPVFLKKTGERRAFKATLGLGWVSFVRGTEVRSLHNEKGILDDILLLRAQRTAIIIVITPRAPDSSHGRTHPSEQDQADATVYRRTKMEQELKKRTKSIVGFRILSQGEGFFGNDHYGGFLLKIRFPTHQLSKKRHFFIGLTIN